MVIRSTNQEHPRLIVWNFRGDGGLGGQLQRILSAADCPTTKLRTVAELPEKSRGEDGVLSGDLLIMAVARENVEAACDALRTCSRRCAPCPVWVLSDIESETHLTSLTQAGAADFLFAPLRKIEVLSRLSRWLRPASESENAVKELKTEFGLAQIVGRSAVFQAQMQKLERYATSSAAVLISGETGTGKEVFARAIHYTGPRSSGPFVPVNCAALPMDLIENELFGHESGAFTGAGRARHGLIHEAEGGTLFLDEIDSLPERAQAKLLRFLQEREYRPLGASRSQRANVRIISASNADLEAALNTGRFRQDLYFRLKVLSLRLPPLRERREDIPALAVYFLRRHTMSAPPSPTSFSAGAIQRLMEYHWPGNVRELENVVERALVLSTGSVVEEDSLDLPSLTPTAVDESFKSQKSRAITDFERSYLAKILSRHEGNITRAAKAARKNRRAFFELLKKHQLTGSSRYNPCAPSL